MSRRDFRSFLTSPAYRVKFKMEDGLRACLWSHNPKTLASIRRVVRETFPVWYKKYSWWHERSGKDHIDELWADFLRWQAGI